MKLLAYYNEQNQLINSWASEKEAQEFISEVKYEREQFELKAVFDAGAWRVAYRRKEIKK